MYPVIDASQDLTAHASTLFKAGVQVVIRYYNNNNTSNHPTKRLTKAEAKALDKAGLALAVVFQQRGGAGGHISDLTGAKGTRDAKRALKLAAGIGQPQGSAIYFAVDWDYIKPTEIAQIKAYFSAVRKALGSDYRLGIYGSGYLCRRMLDAGLADLAWLSLSRGWTGYSDFLKSQDWTVLQVKEQHWPGLGFSYDGNTINPGYSDIGQFRLNQIATPELAPVPARTIFQVIARNGLNLRKGPGTEFAAQRVVGEGVLVFGHGQSGTWISVDLEGDGRLDGHMSRAYLEVLAGGFPAPYPSGATPYQIAKREMADEITEFPGPLTNPRIFLYHASTHHGDHDAVAWCSSFVNYCVSAAGLSGTNSRWAMSWHDLTWGTDVTTDAHEGDIAVFERRYFAPDGTRKRGGHVGFVVQEDVATLTILGGNQSDRVRISSYPKNGKLGSTSYKLLSIRRAAAMGA